MNIEKQADAVARGVEIIVATPGRLMDQMNSGRIDFARLEILILDDASTDATPQVAQAMGEAARAPFDNGWEAWVYSDKPGAPLLVSVIPVVGDIADVVELVFTAIVAATVVWFVLYLLRKRYFTPPDSPEGL